MNYTWYLVQLFTYLHIEQTGAVPKRLYQQQNNCVWLKFVLFWHFLQNNMYQMTQPSSPSCCGPQKKSSYKWHNISGWFLEGLSYHNKTFYLLHTGPACSLANSGAGKFIKPWLRSYVISYFWTLPVALYSFDIELAYASTSDGIAYSVCFCSIAWTLAETEKMMDIRIL